MLLSRGDCFRLCRMEREDSCSQPHLVETEVFDHGGDDDKAGVPLHPLTRQPSNVYVRFNFIACIEKKT